MAVSCQPRKKIASLYCPCQCYRGVHPDSAHGVGNSWSDRVLADETAPKGGLPHPTPLPPASPTRTQQQGTNFSIMSYAHTSMGALQAPAFVIAGPDSSPNSAPDFPGLADALCIPDLLGLAGDWCLDVVVRLALDPRLDAWRPQRRYLWRIPVGILRWQSATS